MNERDDKGAPVRHSGKQFRRDNTPSVIQNVERLTSIPSRASMANIPVLEMPRSQRIWRRFRVPFFISVVVLLLLTVALVTHRIKIATNIANTIDEALSMEAIGTIEQTRLAEQLMAKLHEKHSGDDNAAAAWAWQSALQAILYEEPLDEEAKETIEDVDNDLQAPYAFATRAAGAYLKKDFKGALAITKQGLTLHPDDPRISLIEILSIQASGDAPEAWNRLMSLLEAEKKYIPLLTTGAVIALESGNKLDALDIAKAILTTSKGNLFGEMSMISLGLPAWGETDEHTDHLNALQKKFTDIAPRLAAAPPRLKIMGAYLQGRLLLIADRPAESIHAFTQAFAAKKDPETLAWMTKAVRAYKGTTSALAVLNDHQGIDGPAIQDIRTDMLLEYHRVEQAESSLSALKKSGTLKQRYNYLAWIHAVRSGNIETAKATMPEKIVGDQKWPALEMYFILKKAGDTDGIEALAAALDGEWGTCTRVIRSWHSRSLKRATRLFGTKRIECADHLMPRLMSTHAKADIVAEAAEAAQKKSQNNPIFEIDRARAVWRTEGQAAGSKILDKVAILEPEGRPILERLASAYIEMDLPEKALKVLGDRTDPDLLALRIFAHENAKQKKKAQPLIDQAIQQSNASQAPALVYFKLRDLLKKRNVEPIKEWFDTDFKNQLPGEWTSEIVNIGARALLIMDLRPEAEDLVEWASKHLLVPCGADEAIDSWAVDVGININRGGRHRNRALVIIRTLRDEGVMDPRFSYWLGVENIVNGSERLGLRFIKEALALDSGFKRAWAKMAEMEWMGEQTAAQMRTIRPDYNPPGAPPPQ